MNEKTINSEAVKWILEWTKSTVERFGPRLAGSDHCHQASEKIRDDMKTHCDQVDSDDFDIYPGSIFAIPRVCVYSFFVSAILMFISPQSGWLVYTVGFLYILLQFIFLSDLFDPLFPKKRGRNIIGSIEPAETAKRQIILTAHYDSAWVCNYLERLPGLYKATMILTMLMYALFGLLLTLKLFISGTWLSISLAICMGIGFPVIIPMLSYYRTKGTPGAGDNLASVGLILAIGRLKKADRLKHTRLILLGLDAEEIGMRGARRYIGQNLGMLRSLDTEVINIDSLYRLDALTLLSSDRNGLTSLSKGLSDRLAKVGNELGCSFQRKPFPFGGGGTDAGEFALAGLETTSIIGVPWSFSKANNFYHTTRDLVDNIEPRAIEAVGNTVIDYIQRKDQELVE